MTLTRVDFGDDTSRYFYQDDSVSLQDKDYYVCFEIDPVLDTFFKENKYDDVDEYGIDSEHLWHS